MRLAKQLLGSAAAPAALTNPAVQLVAIELMHLLGKLLNASCLQPEDAHVHTFQELACHCGCRGIEFEDGDARALCTGCNVRYVHVSCCAALKRSSMTCSVCARCTWPDVPQDEVAVCVRRIRHELEQTRPFDVMHALVYETMEEARATLMQGTAENCKSSVYKIAAAQVAPRGILTRECEACLKRVRAASSIGALIVALKHMENIATTRRVWADMSRSALSAEIRDNDLHVVHETSARPLLFNGQRRDSEHMWHERAEPRLEHRDSSGYLVTLIEHNLNVGQPQTARMLRLESEETCLYVYQSANTVGGSSRRRLVAANVEPNTHAAALNQLRCACAIKVPRLEAKHLQCVSSCDRSMWALAGVSRHFAAPNDVRVFGSCVLTYMGANIHRTIAKREKASDRAKLVHTIVAAVIYVNEVYARTGWRWRSTGGWSGHQVVDEEEGNEVARCLRVANLLPETPTAGAPPRYRQMTPDETWRIVAGNGELAGATTGGIAYSPSATLRPGRGRRPKVPRPCVATLAASTLKELRFLTRSIVCDRSILFANLGYTYEDDRRMSKTMTPSDAVGCAIERALLEDPTMQVVLRGLRVESIHVIKRGTFPQPPHKDDDTAKSGHMWARRDIPFVVMIPLSDHFFVGILDESNVCELRCEAPQAALMGVDSSKFHSGAIARDQERENDRNGAQSRSI